MAEISTVLLVSGKLHLGSSRSFTKPKSFDRLETLTVQSIFNLLIHELCYTAHTQTQTYGMIQNFL